MRCICLCLCAICMLYMCVCVCVCVGKYENYLNDANTSNDHLEHIECFTLSNVYGLEILRMSCRVEPWAKFPYSTLLQFTQL